MWIVQDKLEIKFNIHRSLAEKLTWQSFSKIFNKSDFDGEWWMIDMTGIDPAFAVASLCDRCNDFLRSIWGLVIGDLHTVSYMETPEKHKKAVKR